jgi:uncharacterized membrane protein
MNSGKNQLTRIVFGAVMAAIICVITLFRIPLGQSKVHFANAMCLLAGLLLGPVTGGLSAGLGSALYDVLFGGYDFLNAAITFVSKFAMAWVTAMIYGAWKKKHGDPEWKETVLPLVLSCVAGALTYVALYMLKTFIYQRFIYGFPVDAVWVTMLGKLPASLINAVAAMIAAPILYTALRPALERAGQLRKMRG